MGLEFAATTESEADPSSRVGSPPILLWASGGVVLQRKRRDGGGGGGAGLAFPAVG